MAEETKIMEVGRLALRVEDDMWNAYWCKNQDNMDDKILLGSIRMSLVQDNPARRGEFKRSMMDAFGQTCFDLNGHWPRFQEIPIDGSATKDQGARGV